MADLKTKYRVHKLWQGRRNDALVAEQSGAVRVIATRREPGASASRMAKLELVSCCGFGTGAIDPGYTRTNCIRGTNTSDILTEDVADIDRAWPRPHPDQHIARLHGGRERAFRGTGLRKDQGEGRDVFLDEPEINVHFLRLSNVVLQPHHADGTVEIRKAVGPLVRDDIAAQFSGRRVLTSVP